MRVGARRSSSPHASATVRAALLVRAGGELIENALRTAGTAPSRASQQPWTFVAISDAVIKVRIRAAAQHEEELLYMQRASPEYLDAIEPIGTD